MSVIGWTADPKRQCCGCLRGWVIRSNITGYWSHDKAYPKRGGLKSQRRARDTAIQRPYRDITRTKDESRGTHHTEPEAKRTHQKFCLSF